MSAITSIRQAVQGYLDDRQRLGFAMAAPATELMRFARYADARGHCGPLTQELILGWAREHVHRTGETFRLCLFDGPTSVENLCHKLFIEVTQMSFRLSQLEVQETDSSVISYPRKDWVADNRYFSRGTTAVEMQCNRSQ